MGPTKGRSPMRKRIVAVLAALLMAVAVPAWAYTESAGNGTTTDCTTGYTWSAVVRGNDLTMAKAWGDWYNGPPRVEYNYVNTGLQQHWGSLGYASAWSGTRYDGYAEAYTYSADWGDKLYTRAGCLWTNE